MQQVTIYTASEFMGNVLKYEGKLIEHGTRKYAQYNNAPFVNFVPNGKRKPVGILKSFQPTILVLEGIGHPEPDQMCVQITDRETGGLNPNSVIVSESRYESFNERWEKDFDTMIDKYIEEKKVNVIADYRWTKGFNSY